MINSKKVLIIIPAYNEEENIENVVNNVLEENNLVDVVVVNDGSKDDTLKRAQNTKATVIDLPNNLGIGGAVQTGMIYAYKNGYDIAIQIDGDGQHNPKYIKEMVNKINEGYDMVIGSRFVEKTNYKQTFFRMLGINITSALIKAITGRKIYDTTSGFRAVNREIIEEFSKNYPYDYPEPETNMKIVLKKKKVLEMPVEMRKRMAGKSFITPIKSVKYMIKVTMSLMMAKLKLKEY
ncbi:MAG: glycosyltransferase family 2 protein [Clostridia bacterium]|nr:glycosyltransferase family 2 protein [Clostridia bacterium]